MKKITLYVASFIFATSLVSCGGEKATSLDEELGDPTLAINSKKFLMLKMI